MTQPDDPDLPSQAELDAEDLAELGRTSGDRDHANLYPKPEVDPGPAPRALTVHARLVFYGAALSGALCVLYGVLTAGAVTERLRDRLLLGVIEEPGVELSTDGITGFAGWAPWFMFTVTVLLLVVEGALLVWTVRHHSRNLRNLFLTTVLVNLLCIPIGLDLLFRYPDVWSGVTILAWIQFGLLTLSAILVLRKPVELWLPPSTRMRPMRLLRG